MNSISRIQTNKMELPKVRKNTEYEEFVIWYATPFKVKESMGLETQKAFAEYYKLHEGTLSEWKDRPDFEARVRHLRKKWAFEKTQDVLQGMYQSAVKGNPLSQKLWMQVFEDFSEKSEVTETKKVEIGINDIRFIINSLPEQYREKYYGYIREIIDTAQALRHAGQLSDGTRDAEFTEAYVLDEAGEHAQDLPGKRTNELAQGHIRCVSQDMGDYAGGQAQTSASYY